jgi:hypothetical protein
MLWKLKLAEFASLESGLVRPAWGTTPLTGGSDLGKKSNRRGAPPLGQVGLTWGKRDSVACAVHIFSYKNYDDSPRVAANIKEKYKYNLTVVYRVIYI